MRRLLKAIFGLGGAQVAGLLLGMIATKIMAVLVGPSGVGFYSLLRQISDMVVGFAGLGSGHGLIQGLAAREGEARLRLLASGLWLTLSGAALAAILLLVGSGHLAKLFFADGTAGSTVRWMALGVVINVVSTFLLTLVQANGRFAAYSASQIASSAVLALIAYPVTLAALDEKAAFVAMIVLPCLVQIAFSVRTLRHAGEIPHLSSAIGIAPDEEGLRHFSRFILFGIGMIALATVAGAAVRALIVRFYGLEAAGQFQSAWTLGMQNLTLLLTPFMTYVFPVLSAAKEPNARRAAWIDIATVIVAAALPMVVAAIVLKPLLLRIFYTSEFLAAIPILQWMLLANYAKAISWLFAVATYSAGRLRWYFFGEAVWNLVFVAMVLGAIHLHLPLEWIGIGFALSYAVFLPVAAMTCWRLLRLTFDARLFALASLGMALIGASAWATWSETTVNWPVAVVAIATSGIVGLFVLPPERRARAWHEVRDLMRSLRGAR